MEDVYASLSVKEPGTIRFLELEPGSFTSDVRVALKCGSLDDPGLHYEALSYTWGDPHDTKTIFCNNIPCEVTINLFSALRRLRENKRTKVWADALCINQMDLKERAEQVKQMLRIYTQAKTTWMHMGAEGEVENENKLFSLMTSLDRVLNQFDGDGSKTIHPSQLVEFGLPPLEDEAWAMWQRLLSNPYFTRLWVIQEFAVSKTLYVMYGTKYFPWWNLYNISGRMQQHGLGEENRPMSDPTLALAAVNGKNGLRNLFKCHQNYQNGIPLEIAFLLTQARFVNCSNPRDKIFGIIGVAGDIDQKDPDFEIRYDEDESVSELFIRIARGLMRTKKPLVLNLLFEGGTAHDDRIENLPSWIPDWTSRRAGSPLGGLAETAGYKAAGNLELYAETEGRELRVRGRIVDRIEHLTSEFRPDTKGVHTDLYFGLAVTKWLREAFDLALNIWPDALSNNEGDDIKEKLWRTLICNKIHNDDPVTPDYSAHFDALLVRQRYVDAALARVDDEHGFVINDPSGEYTRADTNSTNYRLALQNTMFTKKFCVTKEKKMMGMIPGNAEDGDYIVIVAGSSVPFILRKANVENEQNSSWKLIQECYIHGVMNGEYASDADADWEKFNIE